MPSTLSNLLSNFVFNSRFFFGRGLGAISTWATSRNSPTGYLQTHTFFILLYIEAPKQHDRFFMKQSTMHWIRWINRDAIEGQYLNTRPDSRRWRTQCAMKAHFPCPQTVHYHNRNTLLVFGTASGQMHTWHTVQPSHRDLLNANVTWDGSGASLGWRWIQRVLCPIECKLKVSMETVAGHVCCSINPLSSYTWKE